MRYKLIIGVFGGLMSESKISKYRKFFDKVSDFFDSKKTIVDICICFTLAWLVASDFSLHPIYRGIPDIDSSVFLYMGKMMHKGFVPYLDLFDHKGIVLYFIQYIGLAITPGSFLGVWILEFINIAVAIWFMNKIAGLFTENKFLIYTSLLLTFFSSYHLFEGGNFTEEYALPWIAASLYIFLKYFKTYEYKFYEIIFLGIAFSTVLFLRINMIAVWIIFVPIILVCLIAKRKFKDIGICAGGFLAGVAIVCIPVLIYLLETGSLMEMINSYVVFNLKYATNTPTLKSVKEIVFFFLSNINMACFATLFAAFLFRKDKLYWFGVLSIVGTIPFVVMSGRYYRHYGIILIPLLIVPFICSLVSIDTVLRDKYKLSRAKNVFVVFLCVCSLILSVRYDNRHYQAYEFENDITKYLKENTTESDEVVILGNDVKYYLFANRDSNFKYFYQDPPIEVSDVIFEEVSLQMYEETPDCVLILRDKENALSLQSNLGSIFRQLEEMKNDGVFTCRDFGYYYCYEKINN